MPNPHVTITVEPDPYKRNGPAVELTCQIDPRILATLRAIATTLALGLDHGSAFQLRQIAADLDAHPLNGVTLRGFKVLAPASQAPRVVLPARDYSVSGERRSYAILRGDTGRLVAAVLAAVTPATLAPDRHEPEWTAEDALAADADGVLDDETLGDA